MIRNTKKGSYTLEAILILPIFVLCILSLGYFTKIEGIWENCIHCATDESGRAQAIAWDGISSYIVKGKILNRIAEDERGPSSSSISKIRADYSDGLSDHLTGYTLNANVHMAFPMGLSGDFSLTAPIIYRNFVGSEIKGDPLGIQGLENGIPGDPAYIFPAFGRKYHTAECTYVKATVHGTRLSSAIIQKYSPCSICHSEKLPRGSLIFCFENPGTAYHAANCRTIKRHVIVIDKSEAQKKGYTPCSKCGGPK